MTAKPVQQGQIKSIVFTAATVTLFSGLTSLLGLHLPSGVYRLF